MNQNVHQYHNLLVPLDHYIDQKGDIFCHHKLNEVLRIIMRNVKQLSIWHVYIHYARPV